MTTKLKRRNFFIIGKEHYYKTNNKNLNMLVEIVNKDRLAILSGLRNIGKINFIKELLNRTGVTSNYFYFNKSEDLDNYISKGDDLNNLLNEYIQLYKKPNIIILQNIEKIEGIKDFIGKIYTEKHKILLVGNNIKIGGIKEIEILNSYDFEQLNIDEYVKYGGLTEVKLLKSPEIKKKFLRLTTSDIFLNDIFLNFSVKNIELYNFTITYLANNNFFLSLRELHKEIDSINNISIKTLIDYINFSLQTKILKRVYKYDLKTNKPIISKAKYYFTDNGIRNSLNNFEVDNNILLENLIFDILEYNNYIIYAGLNGKFEFSFYGEKESNSLLSKGYTTINSLPLQGKESAKEKIFVQISKEIQKEEIKKEVNKLLKLGDDGSKYLLVDSIEKLGIKKLKYESVEIMEIFSFLKKFGG